MNKSELRNLIREEVRNVLRSRKPKTVKEEIRKPLSEGAILKAITPSLQGEVKAAVQALEKELQSTGAILDYKHADRLADCIIDIIDAAKAEERAEYPD